MRIEQRDFLCGVCGASVQEWMRLQRSTDPDFDWYFRNDLDDGVPDTELPPGWVQILVRRVVPNPLRQTAADILADLLKAVPEDDKPQARQILGPQAEALAATDNEPDNVLDEVECTVCSTCAYQSDAIARVASVEPEAFKASNWFVMSNIPRVEENADEAAGDEPVRPEPQGTPGSSKEGEDAAA